MTVALFVPCYIDQFYPGVALATLQLLEKLDVDVVVPPGQTCCGQPMANAGFERFSTGCSESFVNRFRGYSHIVSPSGSCVLHLRHHLTTNDNGENELGNRVYELTEFLTDILQITKIEARFPFRVGLHQGCHAQRGLYLSQMSELVAPDFSKPRKLLQMVSDVELVPLTRPDECCGFGGSFCVSEEAVSVRMGQDRIADHLNHGAQYITGTDMSCLLHLEGLLRRQKNATRVVHLAEILNGSVTQPDRDQIVSYGN